MKSMWAEYISFSHDEGGKMAALSDGGQALRYVLKLGFSLIIR